jgi:hypothetical protein
MMFLPEADPYCDLESCDYSQNGVSFIDKNNLQSTIKTNIKKPILYDEKNALGGI